MNEEQSKDPENNADPAPVHRVVMPSLGSKVKFLGEEWKVTRVDSREKDWWVNLAIHDDRGKAINAATGIPGNWLE
jgi:hypothetical protein